MDRNERRSRHGKRRSRVVRFYYENLAQNARWRAHVHAYTAIKCRLALYVAAVHAAAACTLHVIIIRCRNSRLAIIPSKCSIFHRPPSPLAFVSRVKRISRYRPALGRSEIENIAGRYTVIEIAPLIAPVIAARPNDGNLLSAFVRRAVKTGGWVGVGV